MTEHRGITVFLKVILLVGTCTKGVGAGIVSGVKVSVSKVSVVAGSLHWKITNNSKEEVYVYDVFLLGPAFAIEQSHGTATFYTAPLRTLASCPPNRFLPPLLLVIRSGGTIEGDFVESEIKKVRRGTRVLIKVAVGTEPNSVTEAWRNFLSSDCRHSPYDAIVQWGTIIESNSILR